MVEEKKVQPALTEEQLAFFRTQGALGGKLGKAARWDGVSKKKRSAQAKKAAKTRWGKHNEESTG